MTPTPHDITSAEMVAEWRAAMEGVTPGPWCLDGHNLSAVLHCVTPKGDPAAKHLTGDYVTVANCQNTWRHDAPWIARCSPPGISGLLALIESQSAELAEARANLNASRKLVELRTRERDSHAERADWNYDEYRAAEARVTALVRDLTSVKQQCETAVYNVSQREHDAAVVRSFQNIADFSAQALSRSTEKNS